jgi:hypothetical protein
MLAASRGQHGSAGGDAEENDARGVGTVQSGLLDDLMRDAGDGPADVRSDINSRSTNPALSEGLVTEPDLLLRLSGRLVKGCRTAGQLNRPIGGNANASA